MFLARQAHNLKVVGSNPTPETNYIYKINHLHAPQELKFFWVFLHNYFHTLVEHIYPTQK
jgi:hypothetical protein